MILPRAVVVGEGLRDIIPMRLLRLANGRAAIFTSPTPYKLLGKYVEEGIENEVKVDLFILDKEFDEKNLEGVISKIRQNSSEVLVVGIGGGRVLDVSKVVAEALNSPFVSIPTVASHDGIASPMTSIRRDGKAYSRKAVMPTEIIADMEIINQAPRKYLLSGCGDLIAKYSAVRDWWLGHKERGEYYGRYAAHLAYLSSIITMRSASLIRNGNKEGTRTVVEALISAGVSMGIAGSSRPCSGSEHLIAHALEYLVDNPPLHGERCGVATIFTSYLHGAKWDKVKKSLETIGAPASLKELGIDEDLFTDAVLKAPSLRKERYTILHKLALDKKKIKEVIELIGLKG